MSAASDRMYIILRQLYDPEYGGDPPTEQEAIDSVIAYEKEQKMSSEAGNVPSPKGFVKFKTHDADLKDERTMRELIVAGILTQNYTMPISLFKVQSLLRLLDEARLNSKVPL